MSHHRYLTKRCAAALCLALAVVCPHAALRGEDGSRLKGQPGLAPNFDLRVSSELKAETLARLGRGSSAGMLTRVRYTTAATARLRETLPDAIVTLSANTGGAQLVSNPRGALTAPATGDSRVIAGNFLRSHAGLYGLAPADVSTIRFKGESASGGLRVLRGEQVINGIPVFQSDTRFILDGQGRLIRTLGAFVPVAAATAAGVTPGISPAAALVAALKPVGISIEPADVSSTLEGTQERLAVANPEIKGRVTSSLVYFPIAPGVVTLAYQQFAFTRGLGDYLTVVDASSGAVLWRKNARAYQTPPTQEARFSVYVQADGKTPADSPAPQSPTTATQGSGTQFPEISRTIVSMSTAQDLAASPGGWLADGVTTTTGNNVTACLDRDGTGNNVCDVGVNSVLDGNGRPTGNPDAFSNNRDFLGSAPRNFDYLPPPQGGNPEAGQTVTGNGAAQDAFRRGVITQVFYVVNWFHDQMYRLGFDEAAGNFQTTNYTGMGLGNDPLLVDVQDAGSTDQNSFTTTPDGISSRLQLRRFIGPTIDRDGGLDSEVVLHELTHGVANRLIGNGTGLEWLPGAGLNEGWGDFIALSLLNNTNADDPDGQYAFGAYAHYKLAGLPFTDNYVYGTRRFPYTTDNTINPLKWSDLDDVTRNLSGGIPISTIGWENQGGMAAHNAGEVWALTLWEIRSRIIADPAGANGDVPTGNHTMLQLVVNAMKMTPANPSFEDAREALIAADCATNACANERWIWEGFADRGFGFGASAPLGITGVDASQYYGHMSISPSNAMPNLAVAATTIDDSIGNNNGAIDPGEPVRLALTLSNPYRSAARNVPDASATLTTSTPGVTIVNGTTTFGAIPVQGSALGTQLLIRVDQALTCGAAIDFTLTVTSSLGTSQSDFLVRVGTPSGTGAPITYTRTQHLALPDNNHLGVIDSMTITDDFEIADLDFRIDSIVHTFVSDLLVLLRSPQGYGSDLIYVPGLNSVDGGDGNNLTNVTISDQATTDLISRPSSQAPYTGEYLPAFNSPSWNTLLGLPPDPVGHLGRHNGKRTKGVWSVQAADSFGGDLGSLEGWSIIVTPRAFTCAPFNDTAAPITTTVLTPAAPNGNNGWYTTPVIATVSAIDATGAVLETRCEFDLASSPASFGDLPQGCGFTGAGGSVPMNGLHTIHAASVDGSGNFEVPTLTAFKIDWLPPAVACALPAPVFTQNQAGAVVTATVTDAISGPVSSLVSAAADTSTLGAKTVQLTGVDLAGHSTQVTCGYTVNAVPPDPEPEPTATVSIATPTADPTFSATTPFLALAGTASADQGGTVASVTWSNDRGGSGTAAGTTNWSVAAIPLQTGTNVITVTVTTAAGVTSTDTLTVMFNALTYFLAEGSTGPFFAMDIALANPHATAARINLTFLKADGTRVEQERTLPPTSRTTIAVADIAGLGETPLSTIVSSLDLLPIGVERTMAWDARSYGGHGETAIAQPRTKWYFGEGSSGFFHTYVLVVNPNAAATTATVTFMAESGAPVVRTYPMEALSRVVVDTSSISELADRSFGFTVEATQPIAVERTMYFGITPTQLFVGGHAAAGAPDPSTTWYFAEGATGAFFDTYLLLTNPGASPVRATLTYLLDDGTTVTEERTIAANARVTVSVEGSDPRLSNAAFSTQVMADAPIVAERSMYWGGPGDAPWREGHNSLGVTAPGLRWLLAEGRVGGPLSHQTYILLGNPSTTAAEVTITYLRADGSVVTKPYVVPPTSRVNVFVNGEVPELQNEAFAARVVVTNDVAIFVERSLYWNADGVTWAGGTNATAARLP